MKTLLSLMLLFSTLTLFAQETLMVKVEESQTSQGMQPAFVVEVPQATDNDAISILERTLVPRNLLTTFSKTPKFVKEKNEWSMQAVEVKRISGQPLDVFAQAQKLNNRVLVKVFFKEGEDFIGKDSTDLRTDDAVKYVYDYALDVYRDAVEKELKAEESTLRSLEYNLRTAGHQQNKNDSRIANLRSVTEGLQNEMAESRDLLRSASGDASVIMLDGTELDKKKLDKEIRSKQRKIKKNESRISKLQRQGSQKSREQSNLERQIELQKDVIQGVNDKLMNIR